MSLRTLEVDRSESDRAEVVLDFWGRFLWYRDEYSCLPKNNKVKTFCQTWKDLFESFLCLKV